MADQAVDQGRRRFLIAATGAAGGVATVAVAAPFVLSMMPSERAKAAGAPVEVDLSRIEPGSMVIVEWRGKPVWIVHRTQDMLDRLTGIDDKLADPKLEVPQQPEYVRNATRSIKPELMVMVGICTHLGCSPTAKLRQGDEEMGGDWPGGFFCPCHGSKFDLAGRVFKGSPAPTNMEVPPHHYLSDSRLLIGEGAKEA